MGSGTYNIVFTEWPFKRVYAGIANAIFKLYEAALNELE